MPWVREPRSHRLRLPLVAVAQLHDAHPSFAVRARRRSNSPVVARP
jgi:hypothetical protein